MENQMAQHQLEMASAEAETQRKRYHRHSQHQIQAMEAFFNVCPHPDEKQKEEIGRELGLDPMQVKFWFQNKRTQMKSLSERSENSNLRAENELIRYENMMLQEALTNPSCSRCGGPSAAGDMSPMAYQLKLENVQLKQQYDHVMEVAAKLAAGKPRDGPGDH